MKLKETTTNKDGKTIHTVEVQETVTTTKEYDASELQNELVRLQTRLTLLSDKKTKTEAEIANIETLQDLLA